jgi:endonuclease G
MKKLLTSLSFFCLLSFTSIAQISNFIPTSTTGQIITHSYYSLSYSATNKQAEWVIYELTKYNLLNGSIARTDNFRIDPLVKTGSASLKDYKGSGYDRGHLVPAGDMKINTTAMSETFYLSNISPQAPSFNRGIWKELEAQVRDWAGEYDSLYIVTGGILKYSIGTIGPDSVTIPKYYYKIILNYTKKNKKAIAFILPNEQGLQELSDYVVSIDSIESLTGIDFFPNLPDSLENVLENKIKIKNWYFSPTNSIATTKGTSTTSTSISTTSSVQCKGITKDGDRCKNKTLNENGYCYLHQSQVSGVTKDKTTQTKLKTSIQCFGTTKAGTRCKHMTYSPNGKCWQHGGN